MKLIKCLRNGTKVVFSAGTFDNWCVYVVNNTKYAPLDKEYFHELALLNEKYDNNKIYQDFLKIYHKTTTKIDNEVLLLIDSISDTYQDQDRNIIEKWLTVIYGGMIAEENKANAILKKRIKHLGVYQVLTLNMLPEEAASYSKGKKWRELDAIMKQYNI